jgi:hypothetical protein
MRLGSFILALLAPFVASSPGLDGRIAAHNQPGVDSLAHSILTFWRVIGPLASRADAAPQIPSRLPSMNAGNHGAADSQPLSIHSPLALPSAPQDAALRFYLPTNQKLLLRC